MLKKVILGTLFVGLIAVLVIGAINRTVDKSEDTSQAAGRGRGQTQSTQEVRANQQVDDYQGTGRGRSQTQPAQEVRNNQQDSNYQATGGQGYGGGRSAITNSGQYPNYQEAIDEWVSYDGIVTQVPAAGVDLVMETDEGELVVGTGPLPLAELGLDVQLELKAAEIVQLATGQTVTLRDGWGRPVWSGSAQNERAAAATGGQQAVWGGNGGRDKADDQVTAADGQGVGQAEVDEWITLPGIVTEIDESTLVIQLSSGELATVEGRPWRFAQEQGFWATVGDEVTLTGFYEGENFESGQLANITTNQVIEIRQETGRPLWAGGSQRS
jgi:hypothetical protein